MTTTDPAGDCDWAYAPEPPPAESPLLDALGCVAMVLFLIVANLFAFITALDWLSNGPR